jgi:hypothetical protein
VAKRSPSPPRRLTPAVVVLLVLFVVLPVLGLVLHGVASTLAWVLLLLLIVFLIGPALSPQTTTWRGPYKDRDLGGPGSL